MPENGRRSGNPVQRFWRFVKRQVVDDVPEHLAVCEFDCSHGQCMQEEWDTCGRRLQKCAGELQPESRSSEPLPKARA